MVPHSLPTDLLRKLATDRVQFRCYLLEEAFLSALYPVAAYVVAPVHAAV